MSAGSSAAEEPPRRPTLLSASMDRTMMLWRPDVATGAHSVGHLHLHSPSLKAITCMDRLSSLSWKMPTQLLWEHIELTQHCLTRCQHDTHNQAAWGKRVLV